MFKKRIFLFFLLIIFSSFVSAELAYKMSFSQVGEDIILNYVTVVSVEEHKIVRPLIGKYLLVAGDEDSDYEYMDGVFFSLPAVTFVTSVGDDGMLQTETVEEDTTTVYLPYNENVTLFRTFIDNGTAVLEFPSHSEGPVTLDDSFVDEADYSVPDEYLPENSDDSSKSYAFFVIILVFILIVGFLLFKYLRRNKK